MWRWGAIRQIREKEQLKVNAFKTFTEKGQRRERREGERTLVERIWVERDAQEYTVAEEEGVTLPGCSVSWWAVGDQGMIY